MLRRKPGRDGKTLTPQENRAKAVVAGEKKPCQLRDAEHARSVIVLAGPRSGRAVPRPAPAGPRS